MTIEQVSERRTPSIEALAERRPEDVEFADLMDQLRASPRTRGVPIDVLEERARRAWTRFAAAPIRAFVPILVEREVLRVLPASP